LKPCRNFSADFELTKYFAETLLQYVNARKHTRLKTQKAITKLGRTVLPHPPYSPDLAPSDFHIFGALIDAIRGKTFGNNEEFIG
jgi:histone-lysine N-methyltransferase SETMAR